MRRLTRPLLVLLAALALQSTGAAGLPAPPSPPTAAPGTPPAALLEALVAHSRLALPMEGGRVQGPGAERWRQLAGAAQHVLLGEQHGNAGIARLAQALWADLATQGYTHAALETDPWVSAALASSLRRGGMPAWRAFLALRGGAQAVPFVGWQEEAALAEAVLRTGSLWGLDQVFIGSAPWLLRDLLVQPRAGLHVTSRAALARWVREAEADPQWLGRVPLAALQAEAARSAPRSAARALFSALAESRAIYGPFTGDEGEPWTANQQREQAMKQRFVALLRQAEAQRQRTPKVMLKVGAYHGFRGASPTGVQSLGGFVTEMAAAREQAVLTVLLLCGPGSQGAVHGGSPQPCDGWLQEGDWRFLAPWVDAQQPTLFDLRTWRLRPKRWAHLPAEVQRVIGSYDLLVFVPNTPAATPL
jgi:hypothetical protein